MSFKDLKEPSLGKGDYVEVVGVHPMAGKRGYITDDSQDNQFRVNLDEFRTLDTLDRNGHRRVTVDLESIMTPLPRPVVIAGKNLKLVRPHNTFVSTSVADFVSQEFPCLGIAASTCPVSQIDVNLPYGKFIRVASFKLPGPHSAQAVFRRKESETLYHQVYRGEFVAEWKHTFQSPDNGSWSDLLLQQRTPTLMVKVLVKRGDDPMFQMGTIYFHLPNARSRFDWLPELELTKSQQDCLAERVIHHLIRLAGYDVGYRSLYTLRLLLDTYMVREWWKELLDLSMMWSDIMLQMEQPAECQFLSLNRLGESLEACKLFNEAALIYEMVATVSVLSLPLWKCS